MGEPIPASFVEKLRAYTANEEPRSVVIEGCTPRPIVATFGICGGRARIASTRIPCRVLQAYVRCGETPESLLDLFPELCADEIKAALAYRGSAL